MELTNMAKVAGYVLAGWFALSIIVAIPLGKRIKRNRIRQFGPDENWSAWERARKQWGKE